MHNSALRNVLKVGHHGSAYSSSPEFVRAVHPAYALISVGRHNLFGHPSSMALAQLRQAGAQMYRTDLCGGVSVSVAVNRDIETALRR